MNKIKLGYELETGKQIDIEPSHLIVTGLSQKAGKTTCLESLIKRSGKKAIVFRTKIGEKSFLDGVKILPFFRERSDWQYIEALIEATMKEKLRSFDRAKIIQLAKKTNGKSLLDFKKAIDFRLTEKINSFETDILTNLQAYLELVLPKLNSIQFSDKLDLVEGLNIIDLERFARDPEVQSLIIGSVLEEVLYSHKDVIVLIPEAWKFIPQGRGNPCKIIVEEFIRQGSTNKNFLWIDSQDMSGVDKIPLKQISEWVLGYQSEKNEVKHTLDQIPLPKDKKPQPDEIMMLGTGIFIYASRDLTTRVYVQPFWLDDDRAKQIAEGRLKITELDAPKHIAKIAIQPPAEQVRVGQTDTKLDELRKDVNEELTEIRTDFFRKVGDIQDQLNKVFIDMSMNKPQQIDESQLIAKILQKIPIQPVQTNFGELRASIIEDVKKMTAGLQSGGVIYTVSPLEKIKRDFLVEAKDRILADISSLSPEAKKVLKYVESRQQGVPTNELVTKCMMLKNGGSQRTKVANLARELLTVDVLRKTSNGTHFPRLKDRLVELMGTHGATDAEIENAYQHILMEMLG